MVSTRRKRKVLHSSKKQQNSPPNVFQTLLSAVQAPQGLEPSLLKCVYCLLVHLSSNPPVNCSKYGADSIYWDTEIGQYRTKVTFKDVCNLSSTLFEELGKRFEQLLPTLQDVSSASQVHGHASLHSDMWASAEKLNLLIRCCMVILNLLAFKQSLLLENGQVLLAILRKLCSSDLIGGNERNAISIEKLVSCVYTTYGDNDCAAFFSEEFVASLHLAASDPCLPFLRMMLEVFVDELLVHGEVREYFKLIESVSCTSGKLLFMRHVSHGDVGTMLELISTHFFLSLIDEHSFESCLKGLFLVERKKCRSFELSLNAAISLIVNPILLSAPKIFQAHLISLVSKSIAIDDMCLEKMTPDLRLMDCYLSAFEWSVILYTKHMSGLQMDGHPVTSEGRFTKSTTFGWDVQSSFESYIQPTTRNKINQLITNLDNSWHSHLKRRFLTTKSDLISSSIAYMKKSQFILDTSCRDEILSVVSYIILGVGALSSDDNDTALNKNVDTSPQDIYLLASTLKLMSSSLLQILWCLRHGCGNLDCPRTLKNFSSCKEYDFIAGIISRFEQFKLCLPIQKFVCEMMKSQPKRHNKSKMMLLHFSGLLSFSFDSGIDFLVKGCLLTLMSAMNLFIFEGGNLEELRSLMDSGSKYISSGLPLDNVPEAVVYQRSSLTVASKFQKIQALYLSPAVSLKSDCTGCNNEQEEALANSLSETKVERVVAIEEETEETSNEEIFLKRLLEHSKKPSDFDDLVDFIECKSGKNYSNWLKDRQRFRKWKGEKMAVSRWEKKKRTWKCMKVNKRTL